MKSWRWERKKKLVSLPIGERRIQPIPKDPRDIEVRGSNPFRMSYKAASSRFKPSGRWMTLLDCHPEDRTQTRLMSGCMKENDSPPPSCLSSPCWETRDTIRVSTNRVLTELCSLSSCSRVDSFSPAAVSAAEMTENEIQFARGRETRCDTTTEKETVEDRGWRGWLTGNHTSVKVLNRNTGNVSRRDAENFR